MSMFHTPNLDTFTHLDALGLTAVGQSITTKRAILACRVRELDDYCHQYGAHGRVRDMVLRRLSHVPLGNRPTLLHIRVRRYTCTGCGHLWQQDTDAAAQPRAKLSRTALYWGVQALVLNHMSISRIAALLHVSWHTANTAILAEG